MSRVSFSILAAAITLGGLSAVVLAARVISRNLRSHVKLTAGAMLLVYAGVLLARPSPWPAINLAVLTGAAGGVLLLAGALRTTGAVAAFLGVAALVDIVSVSGGLSRMLIERYREGTSDFLLYLTLVAPIGGRSIPIVGIGDLLVGGAAATALLNLGLRPVPVMGAFAIGLLSALAYGLWKGGAPAVPFIAGAVFLLLWRYPEGGRGTGRPADVARGP